MRADESAAESLAGGCIFGRLGSYTVYTVAFHSAARVSLAARLAALAIRARPDSRRPPTMVAAVSASDV